MKIGELFAGYGGLGAGVQAALGGEIAWYSEIDKGALKILNHRFPGVPNIGDITTVDWSQVEPVDILTGGSPCQDLSHAGRRAGMTEGTRSNLWVAMRESIAQLRPGLVVWENVRGAYSAEADSDLVNDPRLLADTRRRDGEPVLRALGRVLGDLSELGYVGGWHGLRAADVGAPHGRFRVFVCARRVDADPETVDAWRRMDGGTVRGRGVHHAPHGHEAPASPSGSVDDGPRRRGAVCKDCGGRQDAWAVCTKGLGHEADVALASLGVSRCGDAPESNVGGPLVEEEGESSGLDDESGAVAQGEEGRGVVAYPASDSGRLQHGDGGTVANSADAARRFGLQSGGATGSGRRGEAEAWADLREDARSGDSDAPRLLPTPVADNSRGLPSTGTDYASLPNAVCALLPTPMAAEGTKAVAGQTAEHRAVGGHHVWLTNVVQSLSLLPTPTSQSAKHDADDRGPGTLDDHNLWSVAARIGNGALREHDTNWGQYGAAIARWEALTRPAPAPTELSAKGNPRLSAAFSEWLMGLPAGWVTDVPGITRNEALKALGNGVVPQQAEAAVRFLLAHLSEVAA